MATDKSPGKPPRKPKSTGKAEHKTGAGYGLGPDVMYVKPPTAAKGEQTDPNKKPFTPEVLDRTVIAIPLLNEF